MAPARATETSGPRLEGLITEQHLDLAELEFPGILSFYGLALRSPEPPRTFLDLLARFGGLSPARRAR